MRCFLGQQKLESTKSPSAGDVLPSASPGRPRHLAHDRAQAGEQEAGNLAPLAHPCGTSGGDQLGGAFLGEARKDHGKLAKRQERTAMNTKKHRQGSVIYVHICMYVM